MRTNALYYAPRAASWVFSIIRTFMPRRLLRTVSAHLWAAKISQPRPWTENREVGILIDDPAAIRRLQQVFEADWSQSTLELPAAIPSCPCRVEGTAALSCNCGLAS